jgi:hypothetical protein
MPEDVTRGCGPHYNLNLTRAGPVRPGEINYQHTRIETSVLGCSPAIGAPVKAYPGPDLDRPCRAGPQTRRVGSFTELPHCQSDSDDSTGDPSHRMLGSPASAALRHPSGGLPPETP